ncbi:MAG: class I SAM-dependent methyltransferase [Myxococcota bacterium]
MAHGDANAFIRRLLVEAGVGPGMRVLDVGCGTGVVTGIVAELVGPQGEVVGVDREPRALAKARTEAARLGLSNVTYVEQDLSEPLPRAALYDVAVTRRVIMYLPDPALVLRAVARALKPGGIAVFNEMDSSITPASTNPMPLHDRVNGWIWATVAAEGANVRMGFELPALLDACGLQVQHVQAEAEVDGYPSTMATIVRAILPRILEHTSATEAEVAIDTLEERLVAEREQTGSVYVRNLSFGICARTV